MSMTPVNPLRVLLLLGCMLAMAGPVPVLATGGAPVPVALTPTTNEDTLVHITLSATDQEGDPISFALGLTAPSQGALGAIGTPVCDAGLPQTCTANIDYTPNPNVHGADAFTYTASDGSTTSGEATVSITITAVNDLPAASALAPSTTEDTPKLVTLSATDVDGDALTFAKGTLPSHGALGSLGAPSCNGLTPSTCTSTVTYTPTANYNGPDSFTYTGSDGVGSSPAATVSITITAVNDLPAALALAPSTTEDTPKLVTLSATDVDGDGLTFALGSTSPSHGTLGLLSGASCNGQTPSTCTSTVTYTPFANYNGPDSFTYTASDGVGSSTAATVSITVGAANDPPVCPAASKSGVEDSLFSGTVVCTDIDGGGLTYAKVAGPSHGSATVTASGGWTYQPAANYNGSDSFTYKANDGVADSSPATVSLTITAVNDPPNAVNDVGLTVNQNAGATALAVLANDSILPDAGQTLHITAVTQGAHGTVTITGLGTGLTYTPAATYRGSDSFTYTISDGALTDTATVLLNVVQAGTVIRLGGGDRYAVSATISKASFAPGVAVVYIASGLGFADALSGAPVAGIKHAPILLVTTNAIPTSVAAELTRLKPGKIVVLGGPSVVASAVITKLHTYTIGSVIRLAGSDRYATSAVVSKANFAAGVPVVYIASGLGFPDALSGAPVAAIKGGPILLVPGTSIPSVIKTELTRLKPAKIVILGGTSVVSSTVATSLRTYTAGTVSRLSGADRYATSAAISKASFAAHVPVAYIATGLDFPNALAGAPVAAIHGGPILLVTSSSIPAAIAAELIRLKPANIVVLGSSTSVSDAVKSLLGYYTAGP
jgi:VCBS repeat-containing protein